MISIKQAKKLKYGDLITHKTIKNTTGPLKVKVNGKVKFWKKEPLRFKIPFKYGLYEYGYIQEYSTQDWMIKK